MTSNINFCFCVTEKSHLADDARPKNIEKRSLEKTVDLKAVSHLYFWDVLLVKDFRSLMCQPYLSSEPAWLSVAVFPLCPPLRDYSTLMDIFIILISETDILLL